jgi:small-conductance mechanosensitive channel
MIRSKSKVLAAALSLLLAIPALPLDADLSTPRRALQAFIEAARSGDYAGAAQVLDLRSISGDRRAAEGPRVARELGLVLGRELFIDWDAVSDAPEGNPADGPGSDVVGAIPLGKGSVPVRLVRDAAGWKLGPGLVAAAHALYATHGPGWIGERMPLLLTELVWLDVEAWQWIGLGLALALATIVALGIGSLARRIALFFTRRTRFAWDDLLVDAATGPTRFLLGLVTFSAAVRALHLSLPAQEVVNQALRIAAVVLFSWVGLRAIRFGAGVLNAQVAAGGDGSAARSRLTQVMVMRRIAGFVVVVVGGALVLLQFDTLRAVGTSLLASAGVAGIVLGFAAQRSIGTLLAGLQISLTQPVRVGDVVVIEGEWGTIEEITLTYVVVKIWDLRRLVVPITRILDGSFQNWTRAGADIMGTVFVYADYAVPVEEVRKELARYVATRPEWDGKVVGLQVTDATERTVQLRALVSSTDSGKNWDLRCAVREHLLAYVQGLEGGRYLPQYRVSER